MLVKTKLPCQANKFDLIVIILVFYEQNMILNQ